MTAPLSSLPLHSVFTNPGLENMIRSIEGTPPDERPKSVMNGTFVVVKHNYEQDQNGNPLTLCHFCSKESQYAMEKVQHSPVLVIFSASDEVNVVYNPDTHNISDDYITEETTQIEEGKSE